MTFHPFLDGSVTLHSGDCREILLTLPDEESVMRINRPYYSPQRYIAPPDPDFDEIEDEEPAF